MLSPLECLLEAKAARDVIRDAIVKRAAALGDPEINAMINVDKMAAENLRVAQAAFDSDSRFDAVP